MGKEQRGEMGHEGWTWSDKNSWNMGQSGIHSRIVVRCRAWSLGDWNVVGWEYGGHAVQEHGRRWMCRTRIGGNMKIWKIMENKNI